MRHSPLKFLDDCFWGCSEYLDKVRREKKQKNGSTLSLAVLSHFLSPHVCPLCLLRLRAAAVGGRRR